MSSILDALNKLEKEKSRQHYPLKRARADRRVFTSRTTIGIIGFVCICIGAIGFAAYYRRGPEKTLEPLGDAVVPAATSQSQEPAPPKTSVLEQKNPPAYPSKKSAPLSSISSDPEIMATTTANQPETLSSDHKTETKSKSWNVGNINNDSETEHIRAATATEVSREGPVADRALQDPKPQAASSAKDTPDAITDVSKGTVVQEKKPLPMDRLEGGGFKIQAISWGKTPQERLVVISNQVLREGDSIEGYQISHINPDDIVLRRSDKAYRLDFGLRGRP